jgi:hypothetical protein
LTSGSAAGSSADEKAKLFSGTAKPSTVSPRSRWRRSLLSGRDRRDQSGANGHNGNRKHCCALLPPLGMIARAFHPITPGRVGLPSIQKSSVPRRRPLQLEHSGIYGKDGGASEKSAYHWLLMDLHAVPRSDPPNRGHGRVASEGAEQSASMVQISRRVSVLVPESSDWL